MLTFEVANKISQTFQNLEIMLQSEFEKLVQMNVSPAEFEHINAVYMNSDLCKEEFAALWVQMNKTRVKQAKEEAKAKAKEENLRERLWKIIGKYGWKDYSWKERTLAHTALNQREEKAIEEAGLELKEYNSDAQHYLYKRMSTMLWEIRKYLKAA
jgi:hypothetical protein